MDLSLLPLVFSLILTVASRLLHPYSTDDKTSRLMGKRLSTVRNTQKGLLVREACVGVLVGGAGALISGVQ